MKIVTDDSFSYLMVGKTVEVDDQKMKVIQRTDERLQGEKESRIIFILEPLVVPDPDQEEAELE